MSSILRLGSPKAGTVVGLARGLELPTLLCCGFPVLVIMKEVTKPGVSVSPSVQEHACVSLMGHERKIGLISWPSRPLPKRKRLGVNNAGMSDGCAAPSPSPPRLAASQCRRSSPGTSLVVSH